MLRRIRKTATKPSRTPTAIDPIASHIGFPVIWCRANAVAAMTMPINALRSSANTERSTGLEVIRT